MKRLIVGVIIGIMICSTVFASPVVYKGFETIKMILNGTEAKSETPAVLIDGNVYIPAQSVEGANMYYTYDPVKKEVKINNSYKVIENTAYELDKAGLVKRTFALIPTPTPTPTPASGDEGLTFLDYNGVKYISLTSLFMKYSNYNGKEYVFGRETNLKFHFAYYNEARTKIFLLRNIDMKVIDGEYYLPYDYYTEKVLPLIK